MFKINWQYASIGLSIIALSMIFGLEFIEGLLIFFCFLLWFVAPMFVGAWIAKQRNRSIDKASVVCFLFGWFGLLAIWLFLKTKVEKEDGSVYYK